MQVNNCLTKSSGIRDCRFTGMITQKSMAEKVQFLKLQTRGVEWVRPPTSARCPKHSAYIYPVIDIGAVVRRLSEIYRY